MKTNFFTTVLRSMKSRAADRTAGRIEAQSRTLRRRLRDIRRTAETEIAEKELRARGLRLYAAWSHITPRPSAPHPVLLPHPVSMAA